MITRTRIIQIGNSKGIRVPKVLLEHAQLPEEVELQAENGRLIVRAARHARSGWAEAAKAMRARGDDELLDEPTSSEFDKKEWRWR
jgi:antitoxin MazE